MTDSTDPGPGDDDPIDLEESEEARWVTRSLAVGDTSGRAICGASGNTLQLVGTRRCHWGVANSKT
jgi:hypothetical protein